MDTLPSLSHARRAVENEVARLASLGNVSCRGFTCNGCCRGEIEVRPDEVDRILALVTEAAWTRIRAVPTEANRATLRCPLLDPRTGGCTVYAERPLNCRAYAVATPAEWCYPERSGARDVALHLTPLTIAWSAIGGAFDVAAIAAHVPLHLLDELIRRDPDVLEVP